LERGRRQNIDTALKIADVDAPSVINNFSSLQR
jgi:hypothetical protein